MAEKHNKLAATKMVKRPLECIELFPAEGGYIVKRRGKWAELGPNERYEPDPDPVVFSDKEEAAMLAHIKKELARA